MRAPPLKWLLRLVCLTVGIGLVGVLFVISSNARVETTPGGAHKRLLIPVFKKSIGLPIYTGTGDHVFLPGHLDGPVVRGNPANGWTATWYCQDAVHRLTNLADRLEIDCDGRGHAYWLGKVGTPPAIAPMPERVVVLSDLEGNSIFMEAALRKLRIVSEQGDWTFGRGRLVILGDSVDRGRDVFAVLWRLRSLMQQAQAAGGAVHVLLGNHEQYLLQANLSRAHPDHRYALNAMGGYRQAFDADTLIGAWLREQPVAVKLGRVLFTHGGISPAVLETGLDVSGLNAAMRSYWQPRHGGNSLLPAARLKAVMGLAGVTRYRGYFGALDDHYPAATQADIEKTLARFNVDHIVVGHTLVERVKSLYGGRVWAVDVNDDDALPQVLVFDYGVPRVLELGIARNLDDGQKPKHRKLDLMEPSDRQLLVSMCKEFWALSRIPQAD